MDTTKLPKRVHFASPKVRKVLKLYPTDYSSDRTQYICEFESHLKGTSAIYSQRLNPEHFRYSKPDFGFNNFISYDEGNNQWTKLLDLVSSTPKHERI
jgi:hypothetical protein